MTLSNIVINDDSGTGIDSDWTLEARGSMVVSGKSREDETTLVNVRTGLYTLNAIKDPQSALNGLQSRASNSSQNYKITWACTAGQLIGNQLTLSESDNAVCTATMNDLSPQAIPTLSLTGLLGLIASFAAFFGWRQRREVS